MAMITKMRFVSQKCRDPGDSLGYAYSLVLNSSALHLIVRQGSSSSNNTNNNNISSCTINNTHNININNNSSNSNISNTINNNCERKGCLSWYALDFSDI